MKHLYSLVVLFIVITSFNLNHAQTIYSYSTSGIGMCDGSATFYDSASFSNWNWTWYEDDTTTIIASGGQTVSNLCEGLYFLVLDSSGTQIITDFGVFNPDPCATFSLYTSITNPSPGNCDGIVQCFPNGGTAPYSYQMYGSPQQSSPIFNNLCSSFYNAYCIDANGCVVTTPVTVSGSAALSVNLTTTDDLTNNCSGGASVSPSGGTAPYSVSWNTGETTNSISGLCTGTYSVTVWDSTDTVTVNFNIYTPCSNFSGTFSSTPTSSPAACDGSITFNPANGTAPFTFIWNTGTTTQSNFNLCTGTYSVTCTDANGCTISGTGTISDSIITTTTPVSINLSSTDDLTNNCSGSASVSPNGGIAPYSIQWSNGSTASSVSNLCAGIYSVTVWDSGADSTTVNFVIADSSSTYSNNPYPNATINDTLYTDLVTNCIIDYNTIDSASLYQAVYDSINQNLYVTWAIYSPTDTVYINDTLGFAGNPGYYNLTISVYCPNKSGNDFFKIETVVYFDGTSVYFSTLGLTENPLDQVTIYPNPFTHSISVDNTDGAVRFMKLMDLNGRVISEMEQVNSGLAEMNGLEAIASGTYLLILSGENTSKTYKVVK